MERHEENRVKWLIDKPVGLFLARRRRSLRRAGDEHHNLGPGNAAHEFGHLANLHHGHGLMQKEPSNILTMWSTDINNSQLTNINESYQNGALNLGQNWERIGGKKMPYRGNAVLYVKY